VLLAFLYFPGRREGASSNKGRLFIGREGDGLGISSPEDLIRQCKSLIFLSFQLASKTFASLASPSSLIRPRLSIPDIIAAYGGGVSRRIGSVFAHYQDNKYSTLTGLPIPPMYKILLFHLLLVICLRTN
jgi:hypothetical protein